MRRSARRDATGLLVLLGGVLGVHVVSMAGRWLDAGSALARSPLVPVLAGLVLLAAVALFLARAVATRRALRRRVRVAIVPADSFAPDDEAVLRFAATLARTRRLRDALTPRASAVRIRLEPDHDGQLRYVVELPEHARPTLGVAAAGYAHVELHDLEPAHDPDDASRETARAELVLARASELPLRDVGIEPDPLAAFANALASLRTEDETAAVSVDLLPAAAGRHRRRRRRMLRSAGRAQRTRQHGGALDQLLTGERGRAASVPAERVESRSEQRALTGKLGAPQPLLEIQVLLRTTSSVRGRAVGQLHRLIAAFDVFAGENHFRASGIRLPGGAAFLGADAPWRRRRFDHRARTGLFAPARRRFVTASEIAGLLKPPTASCASANVLRSGGVIPPAPRGLQEFTADRRDLVPLGRVHDDEAGERLVGLPLEGTFFTYMAGRSRYGKTETGIGQFVHLARTGRGCFFLDPHEDAIQRIKHYLRDSERDRLLEVNFADHVAEHQLGWNLFAGGGRRAEQQLDAVVDAFASALRWTEVNARALNLTTQASKALIDLATRLPPQLAPTIFQIPTLLSDERWRTVVLPHVSAPTRQFFRERFPLLSNEAITPVTNLIDRLRISPAIAAVLGNPVSDYDVRAAMDQGRIVLACPGSGSARDRLVANFLVYDVLHAAKTRSSLDPSARRPFYVFLDEVQTYDGASSGNLAALLEQTAKYGIRAFLFNQNPERLTPATFNAVTTNRSHLLTTALNARAATLLTRELGRQVEPETITNLQRYTFLTSATLDGAATRPFLVHGASATELFPDPDRRSATDTTTTTRPETGAPISETIAALDTLDARILDHLRNAGRGAAGAPAAAARLRSRRPS